MNLDRAGKERAAPPGHRAELVASCTVTRRRLRRWEGAGPCWVPCWLWVVRGRTSQGGAPMSAVRRWRGWSVRAGAVLALVGAGLAANAANAATPTSGTVTDTSTSVSWTGRPFFAPNVTGNVGTPTCNLPTDCDDFKLHVSTPAGYGTSNALTVKVS